MSHRPARPTAEEGGRPGPSACAGLDLIAAISTAVAVAFALAAGDGFAMLFGVLGTARRF